jgi:hypothetical protein
MEEVKVMEKALNILKQELTAGEFLIYLQTITPRIGDATEELGEKTEGITLRELVERAKEMERG